MSIAEDLANLLILIEDFINTQLSKRIIEDFVDTIANDWSHKHLKGLLTEIEDKAENKSDVHLLILYLFSTLVETGKIKVDGSYIAPPLREDSDGVESPLVVAEIEAEENQASFWLKTKTPNEAVDIRFYVPENKLKQL